MPVPTCSGPVRVLAPALLSFGSPSATGLSPQLADAPPGSVPIAFQAGATTGIDATCSFLAIVKVETDWGRARQAQPDDLVPADLRAAIDAAGAAARRLHGHAAQPAVGGLAGSSGGGFVAAPA